MSRSGDGWDADAPGMAEQILSHVAHDLNNLLAPIVAYPDLIKMMLDEGHPAAEYCDAILEAGQQIASLNENLLAVGRMGRSQIELQDVNALVQHLVGQIRDVPDSVTIGVELGSGVGSVEISGAQATRAIANLIANAIEAVDGVGTITVRTSRVQLGGSLGRYPRIDAGDYARIDVIDTGRGIPEDLKDRVFDLFFTTKTDNRALGAGLGLSVAEAVIHDRRGYVDFTSEVDRGTTFSIYLPIAL